MSAATTTTTTFLRIPSRFQRTTIPLFSSIHPQITILTRKFGTKRKTKQSKQKKPPKKQPHTTLRPPNLRPPKSKTIPPAYLHPTASPHAWIAGCAAIELDIDPKQIFTEAVSLPLQLEHDDNDDDDDIDEEDIIFSRTEVPPTFYHCQFRHVPIIPENVHLPEVAFLGRSNVGKSSLINALTNNNKQRKLALVSKTPGRTQRVNYYSLLKKTKHDRHTNTIGYLVDLPGYGYAKAPADRISSWQTHTQKILLRRRDAQTLKRLLLLIDSRTGMTSMDRAVMGWFDEAGVPYSIVLTKSDRVKRHEIVRIVNEVCMRYHSQMYGVGDGFQGPVVNVTSCKDGSGILELMWSIDGDFVYEEEEEKEGN